MYRRNDGTCKIIVNNLGVAMQTEVSHSKSLCGFIVCDIFENNAGWRSSRATCFCNYFIIDCSYCSIVTNCDCNCKIKGNKHFQCGLYVRFLKPVNNHGEEEFLGIRLCMALAQDPNYKYVKIYYKLQILQICIYTNMFVYKLI